ncbi:conserved Plasmodium protein, unknown function [Plasmodium relictum]|uniref:Uncharacterized protein n=1 Tax=Plasmodium relictum TaxID=85471 RepID=A0A1J1HEX0_PLARL|nr:conserved Plasmodium protein, unknown function [Plasmodium relictum]CRH03952.1 conserved Plasmodium protein, unknown function [Plasmodium relictum]
MKLNSFKNSCQKYAVLDKIKKKENKNCSMQIEEKKKEYDNSITTNRRSTRLIHLNNERTNLEKKNKYDKNEAVNNKQKLLNNGESNNVMCNFKKEILSNGNKNKIPYDKEKLSKNNKRKILNHNKETLSINKKKSILESNKRKVLNDNKIKMTNDNKAKIPNNSKRSILKTTKKKDINDSSNKTSKELVSNKSKSKKISKKIVHKKRTDKKIIKKSICKRNVNLKSHRTKGVIKDSKKKIKNIYSEKVNSSEILQNKRETNRTYISECKIKKKNIFDDKVKILNKDKNILQKYDTVDTTLNKKIKKTNDYFMADNFVQKNLKKRKLTTVNNSNSSRIKEINKFIKEFTKNNNLNKNYLYNSKYNLYSYGKGDVFYYLERINYNNEKKKVNNKVKLNVISEIIKIKKKKFIIGSSNRKCDLVLKGNIESEQCELICKCVEKNVNKSNDKNRQINKYNLFIINKSSSKSTVLNDSVVDFEQIKDEDNIFLGMDDTYHKDNAKYIYKVKYNKFANIFNSNNLCGYNDHHINIISNKTEKGRVSKIVSNNFSLNSQNKKIRDSQEKEEESKITILIFLIIENDYILNEPICHINYVNCLTILNNTPKKSLENEKLSKNTPSINKMIKEDSPNTKFNESFQKINSICQSRISPLGIKDSIKKEEKIKGILKNSNNSKELPVTLLNACAELCKEINKSVSKENCKVNSFLQKDTPIINNNCTTLNSISYSNKKEKNNLQYLEKDQRHLHNRKHMNNIYNLFHNNFSSNSYKENKDDDNNEVYNYWNNNGINTNKNENSDNNKNNSSNHNNIFKHNNNNNKNICNNLHYKNINCNNEDIDISKNEDNDNIIIGKDNKNYNLNNDISKNNNNKDNCSNNNNIILDNDKTNNSKSNNIVIKYNKDKDNNIINSSILNNDNNSNNKNKKDGNNNNYSNSNTNDTYNDKDNYIESINGESYNKENIEDNNKSNSYLIDNEIDKDNFISKDESYNKENIENNNNKSNSYLIDNEIDKNNFIFKDDNNNNKFKTIKSVHICKDNILNNKLDDNIYKEKKFNLNLVENVKFLENNIIDKTSLKDKKGDENKKINSGNSNYKENNSFDLQPIDLYYKLNYEDIYLKKNMKVEKDESNINMDDNLFVTPIKNGLCINSNKSVFYDCKEEKIDDFTPVKSKNEEHLRSCESNEFLRNSEKNLLSFLYSKNNENISNNNFVLCLKNEEEKEKYVKVIGEIKVKRNANFSDIKHNIDVKLLDKTIEFKTLNNKNDLKYEDISAKKYSIHLNAFSDKLDETKFNEFSALHLDYIDNINFSDLDILEPFELKKMLFIKYEDV